MKRVWYRYQCTGCGCEFFIDIDPTACPCCMDSEDLFGGRTDAAPGDMTTKERALEGGGDG